MLKVLVTGGCGFIGANVVLDRLRRGDRVRVLDNYSRLGSEHTRDELALRGSNRHLEFLNGDVRNKSDVASAVEGVDVVFHLAAQVAVTTSVADPATDFETNAVGTFNVLEAVRASIRRPIVIYASTNKVYGALSGLEPTRRDTRYELAGTPFGVDEAAPLDFHSPYGCSKGSADQYVIDYARIYGLRTVVFRQSCIYGPWQYGNEDQGWVAHFALQALDRQPITIFGDGLQVRDLLYVGDLVAAYELALQRIDTVSGRAYNIGGGPTGAVSLLEYLEFLEQKLGYSIAVTHDKWRPGDQRVYISDVRAVTRDLDWQARTPLAAGMDALLPWLTTNMTAAAA
jgi:CDP-paratose 2-epimerase